MTRLVRVAVALALAAGSLGAGTPALADGLEHAWASDSVHLAWDGSSYAVATTSFLGAPVAVPGDRATRTLEVTNGGPSAGLLEAWIVDVELAGDQGSQFFDELRVDWLSTLVGHASVRQLAAEGRTRVVRTELDPGESTLLTLGYELPLTAVSGNRAEDGALGASFDVELRISGLEAGGPPEDGNPDDDGSGEDPGDGPEDPGEDESPDDEAPDDETPDDEAPDDEEPEDDKAPGEDREDLAETGTDLAGLSALVAGLLGLGVTLVVAARRRRRQQA